MLSHCRGIIQYNTIRNLNNVYKLCLETNMENVFIVGLSQGFEHYFLYSIHNLQDTFRYIQVLVQSLYFNQIKWSGTRDGLPWASKLRHVAHLTGCKMLWLAQHPHNTPVNKVNEGQLQNQFLGEGQLVVRYIYDTSSFQTFFQLCRCGVGCPHSA